ncbi:hypothetical protein EMCRGX_G001287 [Ephydatia muelleri]
MATNAVSGWKYCQFHQALGVILPERGAKVHAKDAKLRLKDALMRTLVQNGKTRMSKERMRERFGLARDRFIDWERYLKIWPPSDSDNKWKYIQPLVTAFNATRRKFVEQETEVVIDESMGKWIPFFANTPEGVSHLSKIIRNPQGIGVEYKNVVDAQTGIMLFLDIQEGKEAMEGKNRGHVVHGDSAFASVATCTALLERSTYFSGLLKTVHKEFPKKFCQEMASSVHNQSVVKHRHKQVPSHRDFIERLVIILLRKRKEKVELQSLPHSSCSSGSTRGMTMVMMRTVMLNVKMSTRLCPSHSIWMLGIVLQTNLQKKSLQM